MTLTVGTKLGPYEILSPLGAGGMGEVYRAQDTRLEREVAIKVLPKHLSSSTEFKQRFEREAKSISQLAHTNICTLHDIGHQDGTDFLVMELLEGETLAHRLMKGPLPLEQVLRFGVEIASALDAAHRKGVIHRDLKPGNIMLTKTGAKLLDFGLAKAASVLENDPSAITISQPLTTKGTIIGTFQYMAPEQLEGQEADARTDIFALGAVLYEMATGKRAFEGASRASLIASIMQSQPRPISEIQPMTPPALDRLIRRCLAKDPDQRWQSAADIADELRWIAEGGPQAGMSAPLVSRPKKHERFWIATTLLLLASSLCFALLYFRSDHRESQMVWSSIPAPDGTSFVGTGDLAGPVAVSPDGTALAFAASGTDGEQRIWVRPLASPTARVLPGTEGATFPFWSGDGRSLGFFTREKLYTVSAIGGPVMTLCNAPFGRGGTWNRDGIILFSPDFRAPIHQVSATGGTATPVTRLDETKHTTHRWPAFCPDGKHFLYLAVAHGAAETEDNAVFLGSLDGGESRLVMRGSANAAYAADHLLFLRDNTLMATPFDLKAGRLTGEPAIIPGGVLYDLTVWKANFSISDTGILAFHGGSGGGMRMVRFDRSGKELGSIGQEEDLYGSSLSPDGKKVAAVIQGFSTDIWVYEIGRGARSRLTFEDGSNVTPAWSPDGRYVAYATVYLSQPEKEHRIGRRPAMGGDEEVLFTSSEEVWVTDWSVDGNYLLFSKGKYLGGNPSDIWVLPLNGERKPFPFLKTPFAEDQAKFSPDGKWIAFMSNESGRNEIYVSPFNPSAEEAASMGGSVRGGKWQVSTGGGFNPEWPGNGRELFYTALGGTLTVAEITSSDDQIEIGTVSPLFNTNVPSGIDPFDASADGQWFVVNTNPSRSTAPITLITNWTGLKRK